MELRRDDPGDRLAPPGPYRPPSFVLVGRCADGDAAAEAAGRLTDDLAALRQELGDTRTGATLTALRARRGVDVPRSLVAALAAPPGFARLGRLLLLPVWGAPEGEEEPWRPFADLLAELGAEPAVDAPGADRYAGITLTWEWCDAAAGERVEELRSYLAAPYYFFLRPPWAPTAVAPPLTAGERRTRRLFHALSRIDPAELRPHAARFLAAAREGRAALEEVMADEQRAREEQTARVRQRLGREPDADPRLADRYLDFAVRPLGLAGRPLHSANPHAVVTDLYRRGAALGELMGQMRCDLGRSLTGPTTVDPTAAYAGATGTIVQQGTTVVGQFLTFLNLAYGLPACVDFLWAEGASSVAATVHDPED